MRSRYLFLLLVTICSTVAGPRSARAQESAAKTPVAADDAAPPSPAKAAPKPAARPAAAVAAAPLPFRLGIFYGHAFGQSGNLTKVITPGGGNGPELPSPAAVGVDLGIGLGSYVRYHFGVGTEWESQGAYAAKGFRFDLISLGFPILVWANSDMAIHVEPVLRIVRGEILFQSKPMVSDSSLFRIESGIAGAVTLVAHHWFVSVEPLAVDFRVFEANSEWVHTGFSNLWWFQLTAGHEF